MKSIETKVMKRIAKSNKDGANDIGIFPWV